MDTFTRTLDAYNAACRVGTFDHTALDDCHTKASRPPKRTGPAPSTPARSTATRSSPASPSYLGLHTDDTAAVRFNNQPSPNLFVAGEMMAGNVLGKGYTAGVGMSIGTAFGRIAFNAAKAALEQNSLQRLSIKRRQRLQNRSKPCKRLKP